MTVDEFYQRLEETKAIMEWKNQSHALVGDGESQAHCPITAVYYLVKNHNIGIAYATKAGRELGLQLKTVISIINAADGVGNNKHRRRLLKTLGLKEEDK